MNEKRCSKCGKLWKDIVLDVFIINRGAWVEDNNPMLCIDGEGHDNSCLIDNNNKEYKQEENK